MLVSFSRERDIEYIVTYAPSQICSGASFSLIFPCFSEHYVRIPFDAYRSVTFYLGVCKHLLNIDRVLPPRQKQLGSIEKISKVQVISCISYQRRFEPVFDLETYSRFKAQRYVTRLEACTDAVRTLIITKLLFDVKF